MKTVDDVIVSPTRQLVFLQRRFTESTKNLILLEKIARQKTKAVPVHNTQEKLLTVQEKKVIAEKKLQSVIEKIEYFKKEKASILFGIELVSKIKTATECNIPDYQSKIAELTKKLHALKSFFKKFNFKSKNKKQDLKFKIKVLEIKLRDALEVQGKCKSQVDVYKEDLDKLSLVTKDEGTFYLSDLEILEELACEIKDEINEIDQELLKADSKKIGNERKRRLENDPEFLDLQKTMLELIQEISRLTKQA